MTDQLSLLSPAVSSLPGAMLSPTRRERFGEPGAWSCSWCGMQADVEPTRSDADWFRGSESIAWAMLAERVCPFCVVRPTSLSRALEIKGAA